MAALSGDRASRISNSIGLRIGCWISFALIRIASMLGGASLSATLAWSKGMDSYVVQAWFKTRMTPKQNHRRFFVLESIIRKQRGPAPPVANVSDCGAALASDTRPAPRPLKKA